MRIVLENSHLFYHNFIDVEMPNLTFQMGRLVSFESAYVDFISLSLIGSVVDTPCKTHKKDYNG
jgi:hypothetical protein